MNAPDFKTLADPMFAPIFNKGEPTMNAETTTINCQTGEERPSTSVINQPCGELPHNIQGVSGASYAPMDTSPQPKETRLDQLTNLLNETLKQLVIELNKQTNAQTDLEEAVSTTLENAQWFKDRVEENCAEAITDHDFDYEIGQNVERYMQSHFDANDHVDFEALVKERVEDELESIIDGLVADAVEERITDKVYAYLDEYLEYVIKERLQDANITIKF